MQINIEHGWDIIHNQTIAQIYDNAFGAKLTRAIPDKAKRLNLLEHCFMPEYSFVAFDNGQPVGVAGFSDQNGALTAGIEFTGLFRHLGILGGMRACAILSLYERKPQSRELVMDGIAINESHRSRGIGTQLLDSIISYAQAHHYSSVRLDVINSNPRAKKLYETKGFIAVKTDYFPYLNWLLGFSGSTTMQLTL
ncbi:GNAT family N-acetyltransferase [Pseudoalteromonas rubra]|uniref:Molybdopterin-guanine dinucleotide biosynthesis protein MobC n=1 Tax=Pseudoalteromonas rubra TaxID=43658 RepID=A0A0U2Z2J5_9GAMM|nr:GNAT family N-acetyltransferase [Pseudoalteromonas rubra]ALU41985.1 molybdopterin-guanine dinucleotide biosynthesis protein MobC [Pseudoalteromonas rubra]